MTPAQIDKAQKLLAARNNVQQWLSGHHSHAVVTLYAPRSGPGNDRDSISIDIPIPEALEYAKLRIERLTQELREMGVEI